MRLFKRNKFNISDCIRKAIDSKNIKVVSFDIFDTLLVRQCLYPCDVIELLSAQVKCEDNLDILKDRLNAERELNDPYASLEGIYNCIKERLGLDEKTKQHLMKKEIDLEQKVLTARADIYALYQYAVDKGKKVIATSDMYLPTSVIRHMLHQNGYTQIKNIYVSNECRARKDNGRLYKMLLSQEHITGAEILHIGDNYQSDYLQAKKNHIKSFHYPSVWQILLQHKNGLAKAICKSKTDFSLNCLLGFMLNRFYASHIQSPNNLCKSYNNLSDFVTMFVAPVALYTAHKIAMHQAIQQNYQTVYFASRDGYLPLLVYNKISSFIPNTLPGQYLYCSRRAYLSGIFHQFDDVFCDVVSKVDSGYTFKNFIDSYINDEKLSERIKTENPSALNKLIVQNTDFLRTVIARYQDDLSQYLAREKLTAQTYYTTIFSQDKRVVVFDVGYSGSVSRGLSSYVPQKIDKCYSFANSRNFYMDEKNATQTYVLNYGADYVKKALGVVLEEVFSPVEGNCKGFLTLPDKTIPLIEDFHPSLQMRTDVNRIQNETLDFVADFLNIYANYIRFLHFDSINTLFDVYRQEITASALLLQNINYPDRAVLARDKTLCEKVGTI